MNIKTLFFIGILFLSLSFLFACKTKKVDNNSASNTLLENCWTHAYEEDEEGMKVYRPCNFKTFPPSRFRHKFTLSPDNQATYYVLSPTDGHYDETGKWQYNATTNSLIIKAQTNETVKKYEVSSMSNDKLMLKEVN